MAIDIKKQIIFPIILVTLGTIVALLIAEFFLRALKIGYGNSPLESHSILHHVHPAGYRFLSYTPTGEYGGHEVYYDKDRLSANPNRNYPSVNYNTTCRIAFLGDSFTEAIQVPYENSFVGVLERNSGCTIKNYGTASYSPILYLLQWRRMVKEFKPSLVVVQLYSNDISDDKTYMEMAKKNENGEIVAIPNHGKGWMITHLRKLYLMRFLRRVQLQLQWIYENRGKEQNIVAGMVEENPEISQLSAELIKTLAKEVQESGSQFILTVVPSKFRTVKRFNNYQIPQFSDKWKIFSQENSISFLDLTKPFENEAKNGLQLFFDSDIHFNENGHIIVASELSRAYPHLFKPVKVGLTRR